MPDIPPAALSQPPMIEPLDESGGRALVEDWRASGLSGAAYCRANNIRPQRLHYWRERLGYPIKVVGERRAAMVHQPSMAPATGFVQVVVDTTPRCTSVDIVVGGAMIRVQPGFDIDLLRSIVAALRRES